MKVPFIIIVFFLVINSKPSLSSSERVFSQKLQLIKKEKSLFLDLISDKEDDCLNKFFSGRCLEQLDIEYEIGIRDFELRTQRILRQRREARAETRKTTREKKINQKR